MGQSVSVNPTGSVFRLAKQGHPDFLAIIATVVVYFRAAAGLSPDYKGALSQVQQLEEGNQLDPGTIFSGIGHLEWPPFLRSLWFVC